VKQRSQLPHLKKEKLQRLKMETLPHLQMIRVGLSHLSNQIKQQYLQRISRYSKHRKRPALTLTIPAALEHAVCAK
jgi:hypothetical protein